MAGIVHKTATCSCGANDWEPPKEELRRIDQHFSRHMRILKCKSCGAAWEQIIDPDEKIYLPL